MLKWFFRYLFFRHRRRFVLYHAGRTIIQRVPVARRIAARLARTAGWALTMIGGPILLICGYILLEPQVENLFWPMLGLIFSLILLIPGLWLLRSAHLLRHPHLHGHHSRKPHYAPRS